MAEMLANAGTDEQISIALNRCARECKFPVRIPDILQRIPGQEIPQLEAEGRRAWDVVEEFIRRYVDCDVHGNYGPEHGWYPKSFPQLSQRILDTVRRTGGWRTYKCMTDEDYPHQQKRFFEEYEAWSAVEQTSLPKLLKEMRGLQLIGKMETPKPEPTAEPATKATIKKVPEPLTEAELRDRRDLLRQQRDNLLQK